MWKCESERLQSLLGAKLPEPLTPLLVLCFGIGEDALETVTNELKLEQLVASETISKYQVVMLDSDVVNGESSSVVSNYFHLVLIERDNHFRCSTGSVVSCLAYMTHIHGSIHGSIQGSSSPLLFWVGKLLSLLM